MQQTDRHIISSLAWQTSFDRKEKAPDLQDRLSRWTRHVLPKAMAAVFDHLCPPGQTWRIQSLDLDLGEVDYNELESELFTRLKKILTEKLSDLISYSENSNSSNLEIFSEETSRLGLLESFLLNGWLPWNHLPGESSVNQLMLQQLRSNRYETAAMIRRHGSRHERVRKRIAYQFPDPVVQRIIEGLEPNNHAEVNGFTTEMIRMQEKDTVVQSSTADFRKQVWFWVLNYLLVERGTLYNRIAFLKSTLRQMSDHYNISYRELLALISEAVAVTKERTVIKSGFVRTLNIISEEFGAETARLAPAGTTTVDHWARLEILLQHSSERKSSSTRAEFNDLVVSLSREDTHRFRELLRSAAKKNTRGIAEDLTDASAASLLTAVSPFAAAEITESMHFLGLIFAEMKLRVTRSEWRSAALEFVLRAESASTPEKFTEWFVGKIIREKRIATRRIVRRLHSVDIPAEAKTGRSPGIYSALLAALENNDPGKAHIAPAEEMKTLLTAFAQQLEKPNARRNKLSALRQSLTHAVGTDPATALALLSSFTEKHAATRILDHVMNAGVMKKLAGALPQETSSFIASLLKTARKRKTREAAFLAEWMEFHLHALAVGAFVMYSGKSGAEFHAMLIEEIFLQLHDGPANEFTLLLESIAGKSSVPALSAAAARWKTDHAPLPVSEQLGMLLSAAERRPEKVARLLRNRFDDTQLTAWIASHRKQSEAVLAFLVHGGAQLMRTLVRKFEKMLPREVKNSRTEKTLQLLFWKCAIDFEAHGGHRGKLEKSVETAVHAHFALRGGISAERKNVRTASPRGKKTLHDGSGHSLSPAEMLQLIRKMLSEETETAEHGDAVVSLSELMKTVMESDPAALEKIFTLVPPSLKRAEILTASVSFREFIFHFIVHGKNTEVFEALRLPGAIAESVATGETARKLATGFWLRAWKLLRSGARGRTDVKKIIRESFAMLAKDGGIGGDVILEEILKKNTPVSPALMKTLEEMYPVFSDTAKETGHAKAGEWLLSGTLGSICSHVIRHREFPAWCGIRDEKEERKLLHDILQHYPEQFFSVMMEEIIPEKSFSWLSRMIPFSTIADAIAWLKPGYRSEMNILREFHAALGRMSFRGINAATLQDVIFRKTLLALASGNWRIISTSQVWNELAWEICVHEGVPRNQFIRDVRRQENLLPPSLKIAFSYFAPEEKQAPVLPVAAKKAAEKKAEPRKEPAKTLQGGIAVRNAGIVLLNNYIMMLFERLGIVKEKKFIHENARLDSVHHLQYVVTGHSRTEESLLPLNKVMCGIPLDTPVREGIDIKPEEKNLTEGLLKAAIGHWPVIGSTSVEGFRGNWLVRDGLLTERDDRWELTVEKKPYDILLHKSPYSFSIIKYPWMEKPLHVTWPY
ncbi:MAG TPA: contractile injection system tape measure protein [Bacteroidia bacterium]|nr:contractile injection system tape measure protein [Bacteroidia bacterium]